MTTLATLICAAFGALMALAILGFPTRTPREAAAHAENLLLETLQRRCQHEHVTADILEGDVPDQAVRHCQRCGAYAIVRGIHSERNTDGVWRVPMATVASASGYLGREARSAGNWTPAASATGDNNNAAAPSRAAAPMEVN